MSDCRLVVLISGSGSNLQAIIDACAAGKIRGEVVAVISNRPYAYGLERAKQVGIPDITLDHTAFEDRESFDQALMALIDSFTPDLILLAGFMRILTQEFTRHYAGRMLNIHPSRLPKFRGLHTHQRALEAGEKRHGASIHFVTDELDGGPVILQSEVRVRPDHTEDTLAAEVLVTEHRIYPLATQWFCDGRLRMNSEAVFFEGKRLSKPLQLNEVQEDGVTADHE